MRFHALLPVRDEADVIGQCSAPSADLGRCRLRVRRRQRGRHLGHRARRGIEGRSGPPPGQGPRLLLRDAPARLDVPSGAPPHAGRRLVPARRRRRVPPRPAARVRAHAPARPRDHRVPPVLRLPADRGGGGGMAGGQGDARRPRPPDRGAPALLHRERLQRAAPVPLPRDHALAADRLVSVQRRLSRPRAPADPPLPAPRPGPARAALPPARGDDGGRRQPASTGRARTRITGRKATGKASSCPTITPSCTTGRRDRRCPSSASPTTSQNRTYERRSGLSMPASCRHSTACALDTPTAPTRSASLLPRRSESAPSSGSTWRRRAQPHSRHDRIARSLVGRWSAPPRRSGPLPTDRLSRPSRPEADGGSGADRAVRRHALRRYVSRQLLHPEAARHL